MRGYKKCPKCGKEMLYEILSTTSAQWACVCGYTEPVTETQQICRSIDSQSKRKTESNISYSILDDYFTWVRDYRIFSDSVGLGKFINFDGLLDETRPEGFSETQLSPSLTRLTTPLLMADRDAVEIYIKREQDGRILISDDGETIRSLDQYSEEEILTIKTVFREFLQKSHIDVQEDGELVIYCTEQNLPSKIHMLLRYILAITRWMS